MIPEPSTANENSPKSSTVKESPKTEYEKKTEKGYIAVFTVNPLEKSVT